MLIITFKHFIRPRKTVTSGSARQRFIWLHRHEGQYFLFKFLHVLPEVDAYLQSFFGDCCDSAGYFSLAKLLVVLFFVRSAPNRHKEILIYFWRRVNKDNRSIRFTSSFIHLFKMKLIEILSPMNKYFATRESKIAFYCAEISEQTQPTSVFNQYGSGTSDLWIKPTDQVITVSFKGCASSYGLLMNDLQGISSCICFWVKRCTPVCVGKWWILCLSSRDQTTSTLSQAASAVRGTRLNKAFPVGNDNILSREMFSFVFEGLEVVACGWSPLLCGLLFFWGAYGRGVVREPAALSTLWSIWKGPKLEKEFSFLLRHAGECRADGIIFLKWN